MISVLIACATAPINMLVDFLFQDIISAPSADEYKVEVQSRAMRQQLGRRISETVTGVSGAVRRTVMATRNTLSRNRGGVPLPKRVLKRSISSRMSSSVLDTFAVPNTATRKVSLSALKSHASAAVVLKGAFDHVESALESPVREWSHLSSLPDDTSPYESAEKGQIGVDNSFDSFTLKLFEQCKRLRGSEKIEFQNRWGIDFESDNQNALTLFRKSTNDVVAGVHSSKSGNWRCRPTKHQDPRAAVLDRAIKQTVASAKHRISKLKIASDVHVGLEVMHLFIIDLLG